MLRGFIAVSILFLSSLTWARTLPDDMDVAILKRIDLPYVELSSGGFSWMKVLTLGWIDGNAATFQLARGVRLRDENDRFLVLGRLTVQSGKPVAVKRDAAGVIRELWLLNDDEVAAFKEKAAAAQAK